MQAIPTGKGQRAGGDVRHFWPLTGRILMDLPIYLTVSHRTGFVFGIQADDKPVVSLRG
jgi:hypothetical protein